MALLFKNKYRISSARLQNWNYAKEAMYYVTICTKNRENYFGEIVDTVLQTTEIGKIAHAEWYKSIEMRPDMNLELGEFIVMPNHIHGIIMIGANEYNSPDRDAMHCVSTGDAVDANADANVNAAVNTDAATAVNPNPNPNDTEYKNQFSPQSKNLSSIIRGYKSAVTTFARKNEIEFDWQSRFHDHIIRSMDDYHRISKYIINNPTKWQEDKFYAL